MHWVKTEGKPRCAGGVRTPSLSLLCLLGLVLGPLAAGCSSLSFGKYKSFSEWYVGPPGWDRMASGATENELVEFEQGLYGERPAIYGHLRFPELIFQPVGGGQYPKRRTVTTESFLDAMGARERGYYTHKVGNRDGAEDSLKFDLFDAGFIEAGLPYRTWLSSEGVGYKVGITLAQPLTAIAMVSMALVRVPAYVTHDVLKTAMIPVATFYYSDEKAPEKGRASSR